MPPAAGTGSGKDTVPAIGDIISKLNRLEEIMCALMAKVGDVNQQQQAFNIALIRLEQGRSTDTPPPLPSEPVNSIAVPNTTSGDNSVTPPQLNANGCGHHQALP
jgi:hypothetical protein